VLLTPDEKASLQLSNQEYEAGFQWVNLDQVESLLEQGDRLDQALLRVINDLQRSLQVGGY
jgi:hypothetical protein